MPLSDSAREILSKLPITGDWVDSPGQIFAGKIKQAEYQKKLSDLEKERIANSQSTSALDQIFNTGDYGRKEAENQIRKIVLGQSSVPVSGPFTEQEQALTDQVKNSIPDLQTKTGIPNAFGNVQLGNFDKVATGMNAIASANKKGKTVLYDVTKREITDKPGPGVFPIDEEKAVELMNGVSKEDYLQKNRLDAEARREQARIDAEDRKNALIPPDKAGLYTLANESIKNIDDVKKILFPDGTPASFNREAAAKGSLRLFGGAPLSKEGQTLFRKMGAAMSGRQLIQTGVAARPEETQALYKQFAAGILSDPVAAYEGLSELQDFYKNYNETLKTKGVGSAIAGKTSTGAGYKVIP